MPTNGSLGGEKRTNPENPAWFRMNPGQALWEDYQQAIDRVIEIGKPREERRSDMSAGSIYDSQSGGKKPRYSIDGRVVEGTLIDHDGRDVPSRSTGKTEGTSLDDLLARLREATGMLPTPGQGSRTSIADAIARSRQIQDSEAKFPNPGTGALKPRYTGITRTPDPRDQARVDADKANQELAILEARMVNLIVRYVVTGKQYVMDAITELISMDASYPASVKPFGQYLTEGAIELIIEAIKQGGEQQAMLMLEEIAQAATTRPPYRR